ncbi:colicin-like pore-forming protein [Escherichia coli]|uniref:colicin-like pore-forming protein n=1 Tax=Escherichia coli TaxID=562 RepID=UPI00201CD623|nr:colicin-like pore-forming protein [Escherichia coli]
MSGGDGRGHNSGAHSTSGNINGGPTGLGGRGGASDGSGWSSENNPWGGGSNSGIHWGGGSGNGNNGGQGNSNSSGSTSTVMKPGESYLTPWGDVVINNDGLPVMNGVVMTEDNSTLVDNPFGGVSRVLNSLISDMPSLFTGHTGNNNGNNTTAVNTGSPDAHASDMEKGSKMVRDLINEKQNQKNQIAEQISEKQKKIEEMKKVFKHHSYHGITDLERNVGELQEKYNQLDADIGKLNTYKNTLQSEIDKVNKIQEGNDEKAVLTKASEIIISVGDKTGEYLGEKYKALSCEIADNIKNFQGKTIRSYDEAMASINKLMANPDLKINAADRDAIVNAWKAFDAEDMGNKFAALGKTFKAADYVMKANNVREKSIEGYQTGNWGPLMREVESWVISGIASAVALSFFSAIFGTFAMLGVFSTSLAGILAVILAGLVGALIDDNFVDKLNNEIIRPAY